MNNKQKQDKIQEYLKALDKCPDEDIVWLVNQLQELGYNFSQHISDVELEAMANEYGECEKCGGETSDRLIGDESYNKCGDCGWITH
ncbi:hypothetical protein M0R04_13385 [Candidatus Dojkabacteria bacterium]|nr:hypothetical protein [Candidatus Dojkabacteria bacterium]